jgi:hypothetical protein
MEVHCEFQPTHSQGRSHCYRFNWNWVAPRTCLDMVEKKPITSSSRDLISNNLTHTVINLLSYPLLTCSNTAGKIIKTDPPPQYTDISNPWQDIIACYTWWHFDSSINMTGCSELLSECKQMKHCAFRAL